MAKFYLHMQPGDQLGKITKLKYIDDISDDELILYCFDDMTKCAENYIAEVNSIDAFNGRFVMTEVSNPTNIWKFNTVEVDLNRTRKAIDAYGNEQEIPEPGIGVNGDHVSVKYAEDGTPLAQSITSKSGKRTDATPPRVIQNVRVEPKENYLLSLHPELLNGPKKEDNLLPKNKTSVVDSVTVGTKEQIQEKQSGTMFKSASPDISISKPGIIQVSKQAHLRIDIDELLASSDYDNVTLTLDGNKVELSVHEFVARIKQEVPVNKAPEDEDVLIKNMIDRSKKKVYTIGIDVEMELPPKEVYQTIKDVYPEGMSDNFVTSIANRMNADSLKQALAAGLTSYYEDSCGKLE